MIGRGWEGSESKNKWFYCKKMILPQFTSFNYTVKQISTNRSDKHQEFHFVFLESLHEIKAHFFFSSFFSWKLIHPLLLPNAFVIDTERAEKGIEKRKSVIWIHASNMQVFCKCYAFLPLKRLLVYRLKK